MRLRSLTRGCLLAVAAALLSGCGFHLAGNTPVPEALKRVYVSYADPYHVDVPPVESAIIERLRRGGSEVVDSPTKATAILRLSGLSVGKEAVAIGPDGRALEYRLITSINYELAMNGQIVLPPERQLVSSDYSFNAQQILAKEEEEDRLRNYTQDELAELILLRIRARLSQAPSGVAAPAPVSSVATPAG